MKQNKGIKKTLLSIMLLICLLTSVIELKPLAASGETSDVIEVLPGIPARTSATGGYTYQFDKLEIKAPEGTLIKNVVVQFTSAVDAGDTITVPAGDSNFELLAASTTANQSINCTNEEGLTVEQWQEYLRKVTVTLKNPAEKTVRFMANSEQKSTAVYDYNAANKHYYQLVVKTTEDFINGKAPRFEDAYQAIQVDKKFQYMGQVGYMVTVTNEQEMRFVSSVIKNGPFVWLGATCASPYIDEYLTEDGYANNPNSAENGLFYWVSGPEEGTKMWEGSRKNSNGFNRESRYETFWLNNTTMEYGLMNTAEKNPKDDFDGLYVATYPTKETYWVWCNQPCDVNQDGSQGYQKQIINWMIEYDDIPESATATSAVKDITLNPTLAPIVVDAKDVKYGSELDVVTKDSQEQDIDTGITYTYYQQDAAGQYSILVQGIPTGIGNYKVIASGTGYTPAEDYFSVLPIGLTVEVTENVYGEGLDVTVKDEDGNDVENGITYTFYAKDENGEYTIELSDEPKDAGDYKVVISGEGYEDAEKFFVIEAKSITVSALGNNVSGTLTVKEGDKLSSIIPGNDLLGDKLLPEDASSIFGTPTYTWYDEGGNIVTNPDEVVLKKGDTFTLKVVFDNPVDEQKAANYTVTYKELVLNVNSSDSGNPDDPNNPGGSGNPDDPNNPGGTGKPDDPNNPGGSGNPDDPNNPGGSGNPDDPDNSEGTGSTGDANGSGGTGNSGAAGTSGTDGKTSDAAVPQTGDNGSINVMLILAFVSAVSLIGFLPIIKRYNMY